MKKYHSRLKYEVMDFFGEISVDELVSNKALQIVIEDISKTLNEIH